MKKYLSIFLLIVCFSCKKQNLASTEQLMDDLPVGSMKISSGSFQNGPYGNVIGEAQLFRNSSGNLEIILDNFNSSNGPDLHVYLSKEIMPVHFVNAGKLRSTNGTQVYDIQAIADLAEYKYVCIHCKAYNHLFGWALLQ